MDTRTKIIAAGRAQEIIRGRPARWFTGHFDPLLAEHAALLHQAAAGGHVLIVEIVNPPQPLLTQRARAELVAALADVHYVVMTDREAPAPDIEITRRFLEHVRERSDRSTTVKPGSRVLVVRLGAMGDVIHTLPAVASLKHSMPHSEITWVVESKWSGLLQGNPYVNRIIVFDRGTLAGLRSCWRELRRERFDLAVDFQGLIKSALVAACARPERLYGFDAKCAREAPAAWFYSSRVHSESSHRVDKYLDLAVGAGVTNPLKVFPLPSGSPEGSLPRGEFVLASPLAGWGSKQWPIEHYAALAERLRRECGIPLVLNGPQPLEVPGTESHVSGIDGLIDATRRATAIVGVDSGPLHIAAAIGKPGVAIYGPTDPAATGPYGKTFAVLRSSDAVTSYKRGAEPDSSMCGITPGQVFEQLRTILARQRTGVAVD